MKRLVFCALAVSMLFAGQAQAAIFGDGGSALQSVLDSITTAPVAGDSSVDVVTDQVSNDEYWKLGGSGGSVTTLIVEVAGLAPTNVFGIFDRADPSKRVPIFLGAATTGDQSVVSILADGSVRVNFADTGVDFAGNNFGYYIDSSFSAIGGVFFSDSSLNSDGADHMVAYQGVGDTIQIGIFTPGPWGSNEYILAFEDLPSGSADFDYDDLVVIVESVSPVPEPLSILCWAGLLGVVAAGGYRSHKKRAA